MGHLTDQTLFLDEGKSRFTVDDKLGNEPVKPALQRQTAFFTSLSKCITPTVLTFSTVENSFFEKMVSYCALKSSVPLRITLSREII